MKIVKIINLVFSNIDNVILTLFNEPSLGLFYTQQYIHDIFPTLLYNMVMIKLFRINYMIIGN
jgi:hypothetical protein